jgi:hypothetical protein
MGEQTVVIANLSINFNKWREWKGLKKTKLQWKYNENDEYNFESVKKIISKLKKWTWIEKRISTSKMNMMDILA